MAAVAIMCKSSWMDQMYVCRKVVVRKLRMSKEETRVYENAKTVALDLMQVSFHHALRQTALFNWTCCQHLVAGL